jgi:outer membrane protein insertion porin family
VPNRRNLVLNVDEKSTGNVQVGAGLSSIDDLVGFAEVSQSNFDLFNPPYFTGGGQKAILRVQLGTERQDYMLSFQEPWLFGRKLIFNQDLYHRELSFQSTLYNERRTGTSTTFTRPLGREWIRGSLSYTLENVGILDVSPAASPAIKDEEGESLISEVGVRFDIDRRTNSPESGPLADGGFRTIVDTGIAGGPLGGDTDFYRLELRHSQYFKGFAPGHIIEVIGRVGVTDNYGRSDSVPLFNRWFLGGAFNMRGFEYRDVGPKDITGEPLGGETYWFGSFEYSIPVIDRVRFAAFYDIGMVYQNAYSFDSSVYDRNGNLVIDTGQYNDNFGIGVRLNLPIGPLVFDYGIPITSDRRNDSSGQFQFRAGYQRDF